MPPPAPLHTDRLLLTPMTAPMAAAAQRGNLALENAIASKVAVDWVDTEGLGMVNYYTRVIHEDPALLGWGMWLITHKPEGLIVGSVSLKGRPSFLGDIEIGYGISPRYRGHGVATEAARALGSWAFAQPGVARLNAETLSINRASIRVVQKLGMRHTHRVGDYDYWSVEKANFIREQDKHL